MNTFLLLFLLHGNHFSCFCTLVLSFAHISNISEEEKKLCIYMYIMIFFSQHKKQEANCCPSWSKNTPPRLIENSAME